MAMSMAGAWDFSSLTPEKMPPEVEEGLKAIKKEGFVGSVIEPVKYLGQQVVNGINYAVLAKVTPTTLYPQTHLSVIEFNQKRVKNEVKYKIVKSVEIHL